MSTATQGRVVGKALWCCLNISLFFMVVCPQAWSETSVLKRIRAAEHEQFTRVVLEFDGNRPQQVNATDEARLEVRFEALRLETGFTQASAAELELLKEIHIPDPSDPDKLVLALSKPVYADHYVYEAENVPASASYHLIFDLYPGIEPSSPRPEPQPEPVQPKDPAQEEVFYQSLDQSKKVKVKTIVKSASGNRTESREAAAEAQLTRLHRIRVGVHDGFTRVVLDAEGRWPDSIETSTQTRAELRFERLERLFPMGVLSRLNKGAVRSVTLDEEGQPRLSIDFEEADTRVETLFLPGSPPESDRFRLVIDLYPPSDSGAESQSRSSRGIEDTGHARVPTGRTVRVAVVRDGPSDALYRFETGVEKELAALIPEDTRLVFLRSESFDAQWDPEAVDEVVQRAVQEPEVDIVFANGVLCTEHAARTESSLATPVVGGLRIAGLGQGQQGGASAKVHFVLASNRIQRDLSVFHQLVGFSRVHLCMDEILLQGLPGFQAARVRLEKSLGLEIVPLPAGKEPSSVLKALGPEVEAVYLTPLLRMSDANWKTLVQSLNERSIPTFSLFGHTDVQKGVLASQTPDLWPRLTRRLALDMQQILDGADPGSLSQDMPVEDHLILNGQTASRISFDPCLETLVEAHVLHSEALGHQQGQARPLSLERAMETAGQRNVRVAIEEFRIREAQESTQQAQSGLLPQAEAALQAFRIDKDRSKASLSLYPWKRTTGTITVRQLIFDDQVLSRFLAARHLEQSQDLEARAIKLDVMARAGELYLQYLQARALERIERDNLDLTRENLRLARIRRRVGMSGPEDVYRWETQVATQKGDLFAADSRVEKARVALNQVLGEPQDTRWRAHDIHLQDQDLYFLGHRFRRILQTASQVRRLRKYSVEVALGNAPELEAANQAIQAAEIELAHKERRFYVPTFGASFDYTRELSREDPELGFGPGETAPQGPPGMAGPDIGSEINDLVSDRDRDEWRVALELKLPLFQGGKRFHDVDRAQATLSRLRSQRTQAAQLLEQQVRSAVYDLQSSQPRIGLARRAADQAAKNLDLVQDKYARGAASIIDLLDAQNQALVQEQAATIAVYSYLQDLVRFQRAMAWFEFEKSEQDRQAWIQGFTRMKLDEE